MELADIETGTRLELEPENSTYVGKTVLVSSFDSAEGIDTALITAPISEGRIVPLDRDSVYNVCFLKRDGKMLNLYKFSAAIRERLVADNIHLLLIEKLGEIARIQRRSFFRLDCYVDVRYRVINPSDNGRNSDIPFRKTITSDLSGGGIRLLLDEKLKPGTYLECELFSETDRKIRFYGKVVRFEYVESEGKYRYAAGIAYVDIDENDREEVIRYIFSEQRKLLKKGWNR